MVPALWAPVVQWEEGSAEVSEDRCSGWAGQRVWHEGLAWGVPLPLLGLWTWGTVQHGRQQMALWGPGAGHGWVCVSDSILPMVLHPRGS